MAWPAGDHARGRKEGRRALGKDFEARRPVVTRAEAEALLANPDLIAIGMKGEEARKAQTGERVTYGRVLVVNVPPASLDTSEAGEIRLLGRPASFDEAVARVREA